MKIKKVLAVFLAGTVLLAAVFLPRDDFSEAEKLAIRIDAVLDGLEEPKIGYNDLTMLWPREVAPYFDYEGLSPDVSIPKVQFFAPQDGLEHNHLGGYTYCADVVWLNQRVINPVSSRFGQPNALATLVHEMIHTLEGDFCTYDSAKTESLTETATTEVLAALANHGNSVAFYAALDNLRDLLVSTAWYEALKSGNMGHFKEFMGIINDDVEQARLDKAQRFWATQPDFLKEILYKYSVKVWENVQKGEIEVAIPGFRGGESKQLIVLDDVKYLLENFEDMADDQD